MKTALLFPTECKLHETRAGHPERAARLDAIEAALRETKLWDAVQHRTAVPAREEELRLCHTPEHIARVRRMAETGGGSFDPDTTVSPASFEAARLACGAALGAVDAVLKGAPGGVHRGECDNAFAVVRPPGHHATAERAMGFCLFNNVAVAARYAQRQYALERVAILDWDVHHGNGTQDIFYEDPSMFFCSVHQSPLYPGSGAASETGRGAGKGTTLNFPLPARSGIAEYAEVWGQAGRALAAFKPQLILVSAGFDAHARDPLGSMNLSASDFAQLAKTTKQWAAQLCEGHLVCVLEGGYDLTGLGQSVAAVVRELANGS